MSSDDAMTETQVVAPASEAPVRPFYWSVRRELWENRSIYIAPLIVASVALFAFAMRSFGLPQKIRGLLPGDAGRGVVVMPYSIIASLILMTGFIVGLFYCLDALHGERRDRSILFWKSLPVSDRTVVLSKAAVPIVVVPLLTFVITLATQLLMLMISTFVLAASGVNPVRLWSRLPLFSMTLVMAYGLAIHSLWFAPIYSWFLLVSAWARRAVLLWALLPIFVLMILERIALGTKLLPALIKYRLGGAMLEGFAHDAGKAPIISLSQLTPFKFLVSPGFITGLLFAAVCLAVAVRLRRDREPI